MNSADSCRAFLSLGSNLGERLLNLRNAIDRIHSLDGVTVARVSSVYETSPWGVPDQPAFLNCVCELRTQLSPTLLFEGLQAIESVMGRMRADRWRERNIDIDILLYGNEIVDSDTLVIPHPLMKERAFVLVPLNEIASDLPFPGTAITISDLLSLCKDSGLVRLAATPFPPTSTSSNEASNRPVGLPYNE